jgi:hypothetical protein
MKIIYPEKQNSTGSSSTSEDPAFPVSNLFDDRPFKLYKAVSGVKTATITIAIDAVSDTLALFNTNATSATVTIKDNGGSTVKTETFTLAGTRTYNRFWIEYTSQSLAHSATLALTTTATTLEAGVVKAGVSVQLNNPKYGISENPIDYSVVEELSNGAEYIDIRDIVRSFNLNVTTLRSTEFYNIWDIYAYYGKTPMAALIAEGFVDMQWCVFGKIKSISGQHSYPLHSDVSLTFEEVV